MARTAAIALIALIMPLVLIPEKSRGRQADGSQSSGEKPKRITRVAPGRYSMNFSWQSWTEKVEMTRISNQKVFPLNSNLRSAGLGFQWAPAKTATGFVLDLRSIFGLAATENADASITYFKSNASFYGAEANFGWRLRVPKTRIQLAGYAGGLYRVFSFTIPNGYSFDPYESLFVGHLKLEFAFPITRKVHLLQQLSMPIYPASRVGNMWLLGLRI